MKKTTKTDKSLAKPIIILFGGFIIGFSIFYMISFWGNYAAKDNERIYEEEFVKSEVYQAEIQKEKDMKAKEFEQMSDDEKMAFIYEQNEELKKENEELKKSANKSERDLDFLWPLAIIGFSK